LTLLVVSLQVPKNFSELRVSIRASCPSRFVRAFSLLWHAHYKFFRVTRSKTGNACAQFFSALVVLFYVYPLKFLFGALAGDWSGNFTSQIRTPAEIPELVLLYGVGFATAFLLIAAMHINAWRQRERLELSARSA